MVVAPALLPLLSVVVVVFSAIVVVFSAVAVVFYSVVLSPALPQRAVLCAIVSICLVVFVLLMFESTSSSSSPTKCFLTCFFTQDIYVCTNIVVIPSSPSVPSESEDINALSSAEDATALSQAHSAHAAHAAQESHPPGGASRRIHPSSVS